LSRSVKETVFEWLREAGYLPKEVPDSAARFNISITVTGLALDVVQNPGGSAVLVRSTLLFNRDQLTLFRGMDGRTRDNFLWDVRFTLLNNNEVGTFEIKPDPENFRAVVQARGIFPDALTKDRLIHAILVVHKAITMIVWKLERYAGLSRSEGLPVVPASGHEDINKHPAPVDTGDKHESP